MNHILVKLLSENPSLFIFNIPLGVFFVDAIENNFKIYTDKQSLLFGYWVL